MKSCLFASAILFLLLLIGFCYILSIGSDHPLGNNLYMMDWGDESVIVQGSFMENGRCYGGALVVPLYEEQYDSLGEVREYVIDAIADERMILAKTFLVNERKYKYYLINKEFDENASETQIRDSFTYEFYSLEELTSYLEKINSSLSLR